MWQNMRVRIGIRIKLFFWYFALVFIFCGTIFILFNHIRQIMKISEAIVNNNYEISSASKKMIENLLTMEENEKKYGLLKKKEYRDYFISAQREFEWNLAQILRLVPPKTKAAALWEQLQQSYQEQRAEPAADSQDHDLSKQLWIPEDLIDGWIQQISVARTKNEHDVESKMKALNQRGRNAVRSGYVGLGGSFLVGLLGSMFLAHTMARPLRELLRGIRSIPQREFSKPIRVLSKDEFGELAAAFNEMAARLSLEERMRADFISMLSHEVRTPLTSIRESVNLIAEEVMGAINDRQKRFLEIASTEIERITKLLNDLMQVSRMEAGELHLNPCLIDPVALVSGSVYRLAPAAEAKGINLRTQVSPEMPQVLADPDHLRQVILNFVGNAIKFSPQGGDVVVSAVPDEGDARLKFCISDNGPGIPKEEIPLVFNKYYRASGVRDQVDGVGLGLTISKQIVEAHGGAVWVESREGQGSTFYFTLPTVRKE